MISRLRFRLSLPFALAIVWLLSTPCAALAAVPGSTTEYIYDALGRRIGKVVDGVAIRFVYGAEPGVLEERAADGTLSARYTYGARIDEPLIMERAGSTYTFHRDAQGSIVALSDTSGNLVEQVKYSVYGEPSIFDAAGTPLPATGVSNPYLFTGRRYDAETGNYHYRARGYSPTMGRFLQTDPMAYAAGSMNLYQYVNDNPLRFVDPLGVDEIPFHPLPDKPIVTEPDEPCKPAMEREARCAELEERSASFEDALAGLDTRIRMGERAQEQAIAIDKEIDSTKRAITALMASLDNAEALVASRRQAYLDFLRMGDSSSAETDGWEITRRVLKHELSLAQLELRARQKELATKEAKLRGLERRLSYNLRKWQILLLGCNRAAPPAPGDAAKPERQTGAPRRGADFGTEAEEPIHLAPPPIPPPQRVLPPLPSGIEEEIL